MTKGCRFLKNNVPFSFMSQVNVEDIFKLSGIQISDENRDAFQTQIDAILDYMSVINRVKDTPNPEFEWPLQRHHVTRADTPTHFSHPLIEKNAPDFKDGGFAVPKIIDE